MTRFGEKREMEKRQRWGGGAGKRRSGTSCLADKPLRREPSRHIISHWGYAEVYLSCVLQCNHSQGHGERQRSGDRRGREERLGNKWLLLHSAQNC